MEQSYSEQIIIEVKELLKTAVDENRIELVIDALDLLENPLIDDFGEFMDDNF